MQNPVSYTHLDVYKRQGLYTALSIQIAQYLGADRQDDARSVLRQAMLFNVILGVGAALFGLGISPFLPGWLGADPSLRADVYKRQRQACAVQGG